MKASAPAWDASHRCDCSSIEVARRQPVANVVAQTERAQVRSVGRGERVPAGSIVDGLLGADVRPQILAVVNDMETPVGGLPDEHGFASRTVSQNQSHRSNPPTVIFSAPQGWGKTRNAEALRREFACTAVVDEFDERHDPPGALHLTDERAAEISACFPHVDRVSVIERGWK